MEVFFYMQVQYNKLAQYLQNDVFKIWMMIQGFNCSYVTNKFDIYMKIQQEREEFQDCKMHDEDAIDKKKANQCQPNTI